MHTRKVAITGLGIVSCLGVGKDAVVRSLSAMSSGVRLIPERQLLGFRSALSGVIPEFSPRHGTLSRKRRKSMTEFVEWSYEAAAEAVDQAGLEPEQLQSPRAGLIFGNDSVAASSYQQAHTTYTDKSTASLHSGMVFQSMNSSITMNLNTIFGTRGAAWTLSGACASGGHALGQAADLIAAGRQDLMICGGGQEITWESVCSFDALCAFSTREDAPTMASRPFDAERDGLVPSGGAAAVVLESFDHAQERGATILGEIVSYAFSSDGGHIAVPTGEGLVRCMAEALQRAELTPDSIAYVCAHGTSTPVGDAAEAEAIAAVFGSHQPWVSSIKSQTGHEMWMAGASQIVYCLLGAHNGFIPGNLNYQRPDERTAAIKVAPEPITTAPELILCNAAGFGGTNSSLIVRAC